jgi:hypothetical protein
MKKQSKSSTALASVMAVILAVPASVWADGGHGNNGYKSGARNSHYNNHYNYHYQNVYPGHYKSKGYYGRGYKGKGYYGKGYSYPNYYSCNNCSNHNHHDNHNNYKLWLGILGGGIAGYVLSNIQHDQTVAQDYYPPANATAPVTVTRYQTTVTDSTCLQEREYRSKIMVGGKRVEGYGTACLQPDGSWRYGPVQPELY